MWLVPFAYRQGNAHHILTKKRWRSDIQLQDPDHTIFPQNPTCSLSLPTSIGWMPMLIRVTYLSWKNLCQPGSLNNYGAEILPSISTLPLHHHGLNSTWMKSKLLFPKATEIKSLSITISSILLTTHIAHIISFIYLCGFFFNLFTNNWEPTIGEAQFQVLGTLWVGRNINKKVNMQENWNRNTAMQVF